METFDTNVIVRILVEDDPLQSKVALKTWQLALETNGVFFPKLVLAEVIWVLSVSYGFNRQAIFGVVDTLLRTEGLEIEDKPCVLAALEAYSKGNADFSDYLILELARVTKALPVQTFDRRFARHPDVSLLAPE